MSIPTAAVGRSAAITMALAALCGAMACLAVVLPEIQGKNFHFGLRLPKEQVGEHDECRLSLRESSCTFAERKATSGMASSASAKGPTVATQQSPVPNWGEKAVQDGSSQRLWFRTIRYATASSLRNHKCLRDPRNNQRYSTQLLLCKGFVRQNGSSAG